MIDIEKHMKANQYGMGLCNILSGKDTTSLQEYPDTSDQSIVQYIFDSLDEDTLYNDALYEEIQRVLDMWLIEEISASTAKQQLLSLLADYYDFGC